MMMMITESHEFEAWYKEVVKKELPKIKGCILKKLMYMAFEEGYKQSYIYYRDTYGLKPISKMA